MQETEAAQVSRLPGSELTSAQESDLIRMVLEEEPSICSPAFLSCLAQTERCFQSCLKCTCNQLTLKLHPDTQTYLGLNHGFSDMKLNTDHLLDRMWNHLGDPP